MEIVKIVGQLGGHGDLKPENILLDKENNVFISEYGWAQCLLKVKKLFFYFFWFNIFR